jgi:hypothetical protein
MSVETVSPYGYRLVEGDGDQPQAYVPQTGAEPLQATDTEADPSGQLSYVGSGQPVGPDLWRRVLEASQTPEGARMLRQLLGVDTAAPREFVYEGTSGFQTDASGNATAVMFDVPQGARAYLTRALIEVGGNVPGSAASAAAWLGIYETGGGDRAAGAAAITTATYQPGALRAFAPNGNSGGLFLPCLLTDQDDAAWGFRSGMRAVAILAGIAGLATKQATIAYRFNVRFDQAAV